jgi:hypothetical protein
MSEFQKTLLICFFITIFSACSQKNAEFLPSSISPTTAENITHESFQILELDIYTPTPTRFIPTYTLTNTPIPTEDNESINTDLLISSTPITTTSSATPPCENKAEFVKNINLGDYTQFKTGEPFAKIWRIRNTGTCTWTNKYHIVFLEGFQVGSEDQFSLTSEVLPDETIDIRINGNAPIVPGEYSSYWLLQDEQGDLFGLGNNAEEPLAIIIIVTQYTELYDPDPGPT